jgi:uncharacterized ferritin-like protein (DUF455 family)
MNFFHTLQEILLTREPNEKITRFQTFYAAYKNGETSFEATTSAMLFTSPSYSNHCTIVAPQKVPRRKNLHNKEGQIALLHAVAHIEYSAIDLALDAAYRFRNLPQNYYEDWLEVADDEIRHFQMIEVILKELGSFYGDIEVHNALFEAQERTAHSFLHRMAVVPRYLEANGLDATPQVLQRLQRLSENKILNKITHALEIIVDEEIDHVLKGDRWFTYACDSEGLSKDIYFDIIQKYYPNTFDKQRHLNVEARKASGFTCKELQRIASENICEEPS